MSEKIVVTGYGIISSLGVGIEKNKEALLKGRKSIGRVSHICTLHTNLPCGEVKESDEELRAMLGIAPETIVTRNPLLAMVAMKEAIAISGLTDETSTAFINGTTVGGMEKSEQFYRDFFKGENTEYITAHDCGYGTEIASRIFGRFDYMTTVSTACSSAANSIILGADMIKNHRVDAAIVGGSESLSKFHLNGFNSLMILEKEPCKPFNRDNNGLNLGEGAAFIVIESETSAKRRGAKILCELSGYANCCDAYHQTATSPDSVGEVLAMTEALKNAKLETSAIDYINAHGTGTPDNDLHESLAIQKVFRGNVPPFSSTKSYTGHTTSAAGAIEAVFSILSLCHNFIPANTEFQQPLEETNMSPVSEILHKEINHVMSNSFGFGGNDSCCIFSKYNPQRP